jgi:hypothetical protein
MVDEDVRAEFLADRGIWRPKQEDGGMNDETRVILASIRAEIDRWKGRKLKFEGEEKQAEAKAIMSDVNNLLAPLVFRPPAVKANGYEAAKRDAECITGRAWEAARSAPRL